MKSFWSIFIISLFLAILLTLLPLPSGLTPYRPAWLLLTVIYWVLKSPTRVGIGIAAVIGLLLDSLQGVLLGENMLCFIIIAYLVIKMQHQLIRVQIFSVLLLVLLNQILLTLIESLQKQPVSLQWFLGSLLLSALVWPLIAGCLDYRLKKYQR